MTKPRLGVYGPKVPERSGVANYIAAMDAGLRRYFDCTYVSNADWVAPAAFDFTLYHVGASRRHHCVFEALRLRRGPVIVHEHNCLSYYYEGWDALTPAARREFLTFVSARFAVPFSTLPEFVAYADALAAPDRYALDAAIEALFMRRATAAVTHSSYVAAWLRQRYPLVPIEVLACMAGPLSLEAGRGARQRLGLGGDEFVFGSFGYIGEYKRTHRILEAWRAWVDRPPRATLLLVGERQYDLTTDGTPGVRWLDYVESDDEFDAYLAAVDCAVQLRHPTLGETSAVISKLLANHRLVIVSATPYTQEYAPSECVIRVPPDERECSRLQAAFREAMCRDAPAFHYNRANAPDEYARRVAAIIAPAAAAQPI